MKHPLNAEIFVDLRPMDSMAIADNLVVVSLGWSRVAEPPRPCQRHTDDAPVNEMESNQLVRY